jgi:serine/threonine protein kinase
MYFGFLILQGLRFLKDYKVVHLDLKPSNVMIAKN